MEKPMGCRKNRSEGPSSCSFSCPKTFGYRTFERDRGQDIMATIRASCQTCGDVELTTRDVRVRVCLDDNRGEYAFRCPACQMTVIKPAEPRTIDLLVASGVHLDTWTLPAELSERPDGDPISHDDLLDFHRLLHNDLMLSEALEQLRH